MGNGVEWAYMLPIEAIFESISKTLGSLHPEWPLPEVQVACEEAVASANEINKILPKPNTRIKFSDSTSTRVKLSDSRSDERSHKNSPMAWNFERIQYSMERRRSDLTDDSTRSSTNDESWARKGLLSLGKKLRS